MGEGDTGERLATLEEQVKTLFRAKGDLEARMRLSESREARILAWAAVGAALGSIVMAWVL